MKRQITCTVCHRDITIKLAGNPTTAEKTNFANLAWNEFECQRCRNKTDDEKWLSQMINKHGHGGI